jgi:predicted glycosyltransferase
MRHRYLLYAVDGLGLGHVTRLLSLARALRDAEPAAEILFLTASEASHVIYHEGFACLKVPSRTAAGQGRLRRDSYLRLMQSVVWNALMAFDPHCLVVDTFAAGTMQELLPILRWPLRKVFIFREQRPERAHDPFLQQTLRLYDLILVPHAAGDAAIPTPAELIVVWTGPMLLREPHEMLERAAARNALDLPPDQTIGLITLGGGGDRELTAARSQLRQASAAVAAPVLWVEALGPLYNDFSTQSSEVGWRVLRDVYPLLNYLHAFDFAIATAGYNTVHELQAAAVPTVLWPFPRDLDDQSDRAERLARAGRTLRVGEGATADRTAELVTALHQVIQPAIQYTLREAMLAAPPANGALAGAKAIVELLNSRSL